jgi:hypothetical protein
MVVLAGRSDEEGERSRDAECSARTTKRRVSRVWRQGSERGRHTRIGMYREGDLPTRETERACAIVVMMVVEGNSVVASEWWTAGQQERARAKKKPGKERHHPARDVCMCKQYPR